MVNATQAGFHNGIKDPQTALRHYLEARGPNSSIQFTMTNTTVITQPAVACCPAIHEDKRDCYPKRWPNSTNVFGFKLFSAGLSRHIVELPAMYIYLYIYMCVWGGGGWVGGWVGVCGCPSCQS